MQHALVQPFSIRMNCPQTAEMKRETVKVLSRTLLLLLFVAPASWAQATQANSGEVIVVNASAPVHPFPHFWEQMFGSGRAVLTLRESYREDLRQVKRITAFKY